MTDHDGTARERDELIGAALAGALTPAQSARLDALAREDAELAREIAELRDAAALLGAHAGAVPAEWIEEAPSADLRARVVGIAGATGEDEAPAPLPRTSAATTPPVRRRRRWLLPVAVAASLALGLAIGLGAPALWSGPPVGPPGTLGAIEQVDLAGAPPGIRIDAELVAHTWGTEAIIEAEGLETGRTYAVTVVGLDGQEFSAGAMLGSEVEILCHLNAAVLREDVAAIVVTDADGETLARADVPRT